MKGIFKIYYKQQQFLRQAHRQIKNYDNGTSSSSTQTTNFSANNSNLNSNNLTRRFRQESTQSVNNLDNNFQTNQPSTSSRDPQSNAHDLVNSNQNTTHIPNDNAFSTHLIDAVIYDN